MKKILTTFLSTFSFILCACTKEGEKGSLCDEYMFEGSWRVDVLTTREDLETHEITKSDNTFYLDFLANQEGYYDHDKSRRFIWGTQCTPFRLLISSEFQSTEPGVPELYLSEMYSIITYKSNDSIIILYKSDFIVPPFGNEKVTQDWKLLRD